jgi:hypothetical protein
MSDRATPADAERLAEEYLKDETAWPLGSSSRIAPAVRGFAVWLDARGVRVSASAEGPRAPSDANGDDIGCVFCGQRVTVLCADGAHSIAPVNIRGAPSAPPAPGEAHRLWAVANVRRRSETRPAPKCHDSLTSGIEVGCMACALELGRREGHVEAGAWLTHEEAMAEIRDSISATPAPEGTPE